MSQSVSVVQGPEEAGPVSHVRRHVRQICRGARAGGDVGTASLEKKVNMDELDCSDT